MLSILTTSYGNPTENRDYWVKDHNIAMTEGIIRESAKDAALDMIKDAPQYQIDEFQYFISRYTTYDDIKNFVRFEVIEPEIVARITDVERRLHKDMTDIQSKNIWLTLLKVSQPLPMLLKGL